MKQRIVNTLKYNKCIYTIYYYVMSFVMNILKNFVVTDNNLILFNSYAGRKYDDSPKAIFDEIKNDPRFSKYKLVWAFHNPEQFNIEGAEKIKTDSFSYFKMSLKAKVWITNSSVERGLRFKKKNTFYFNTWHGTPIKKMGSDIADVKQSFCSKGKSNIDIMTSQGRYETEIFSRTFGIPRENFLECGLPRNDVLTSYSVEEQVQIKKKLGIPINKKIILYCPTFRDYEKDENDGCVLIPPIDLNKWKDKLGQDYVLLFRAHYEVSKIMNIQENNFVRNMTDYLSLNDLLIVSDILISDYSSVFFDFSITGKRMLYFTYDYEKYFSMRGMYFDIREYLTGSDCEDGIIKQILSSDAEEEKKKTIQFRKQFVDFYGNATKQCVDCIAQHLL